MELHPRAVKLGVRLIAYDVIGSTNAEALAFARDGERGPLWVTAERQSAGRGRRGRPWISEPGNLYASLLLYDPAPPVNRSELSFVTALALHDALVQVAPAAAPRLALKWPNDLLLDGRKVAGILIEGLAPDGVVIGIGVNCISHPPETETPATDFAMAALPVGAGALFESLSGAMLDRLGQWARGDGFGAIRADWLGRATGVGTTIAVRLPDRTLTGVFEDIDAAGRLMLKSPDGALVAVTAGEVFSLPHDQPLAS